MFRAGDGRAHGARRLPHTYQKSLATVPHARTLRGLRGFIILFVFALSSLRRRRART